MKTFLVSCDLDKPGQDYPRISDRLKELGADPLLGMSPPGVSTARKISAMI